MEREYRYFVFNELIPDKVKETVIDYIISITVTEGSQKQSIVLNFIYFLLFYQCK